ncbi:MAG: error-prone DNA polymerase [Thermoanaerobaculia bacterium]
METYVPLFVRSNFSFLEGASHPEELVERAAELGLPALALTDRDGVYGMPRAHLKAREMGVKLLPGATVTVEDGGRIVLLAAEQAGWANLCRLLTRGRLRCPKGESQVTWREVCEHAEGVLALWSPQEAWVQPLHDAFGDRLYALLTRHRQAEEAEIEARVREPARRFHLPLVAAHEVLYHQRARRRLQDVLTAVRHRTSVTDAGRHLKPNAEHDLKTPHAFARLYADLPETVERTREIADRCRFSLDQIRYRYPSERLPTGMTSAEWLRELTFEGARGRYGGEPPPDVREQLERELTLIEALDYPGYFLTMCEIVRYCREHGILAQGRGSAANSAVCYCLGVTAIDPVRMGLLFERFLSQERAEPPDIDLDIEHERREEVIQHVYAKYGRNHAAMVANVIRYRPRSAVRDVGKALGLPETALDRLAKLLSHWGRLESETFQQAGLDPERGSGALLYELATEILDFPRHLSIHPGGFLLGHRPVSELVPIENATMEDRTVIQWDKEDVESLGLFKVDLLGLGALTLLHRSFDLLNKEHLSLAKIPEGDEPTYEMVRRGDTVGVFQIESRAQMAMLPRLKPKNFYDLVIEISIVRPGPISGNMVHPYLKRRNEEEEATYPHPDLEPVLKKTLGIPLFQEQVMKLAVVAADYTPGEADQLRRDMAAWRRSGRIRQHHERLITRMMAKGIEPEFAERVYEQICGFGEYGFPESHAASFALIAYATAYLKCHHPAEFLCAILNSQPMGFYSPATLVEDAKRHGVEVRPVDVTKSEWECTMEARAVWLGLGYVKSLGAADGDRILAARRSRPFTDYADFVRRVPLARDRLDTLAAAGAFESLELHRRQALWDGRKLAAQRAEPLRMSEREPRPPLVPLDLADVLEWDYQTTGLSPRGHSLTALREELTAQGLPTADEVRGLGSGRRVRYAGWVICRQRPGTAKGVVFLTLEDETGFVNVVIWQDVWKRHDWVVKSSKLLGVTGKIQAEEGVVHVVADEFWVPRLGRRPVGARSRDFH